MSNNGNNIQNLKESIQIQLDIDGYGYFLDSLHQHITEWAPSKYDNHDDIEVENHHTQRGYSIRGEEILDVPKQKQLVYRLDDGSEISITYHESSNILSLTIDVHEKKLTGVLEKTSMIREVLLGVIRDHQETNNIV